MPITHYMAVQGSLFSSETRLFGINDVDFREEAIKLGVSDLSVHECVNGVIVNRDPMYILNLVSRFGYRVVASSGSQECVWTMVRHIDI